MATASNSRLSASLSSPLPLPLRVALTRPSGANSRLQRALLDRGIDATEVPLVAVSLLDGAVETLVQAVGDGEGVWIAVTSANATEAVAKAVEVLGFQPPIAAIGPATAAAAQHRNLEVTLLAPQPLARSLAEALAAQHPRLVVWSQASSPLPDLGHSLQAFGIDVAQVPTYTTIAAQLSEADRAAVANCDLITVASPSAVFALAEVTTAQGAPPLVSIGPTTSEAARGCGFDVLAEAETPSLPAMIDAITRACVTLEMRRFGR